MCSSQNPISRLVMHWKTHLFRHFRLFQIISDFFSQMLSHPWFMCVIMYFTRRCQCLFLDRCPRIWQKSCRIKFHQANHQLRGRKALLQFKDVPLRTRRALSLYKVYGNSALLVLNETSLNSINTLLALNWQTVNSY